MNEGLRSATTRRAGSDAALYHRIYMVLREKILDHRLCLGSPDANELELARNFAVSRITIRKTLERLERRGADSAPAPVAATFATPPAGRRVCTPMSAGWWKTCSRWACGRG